MILDKNCITETQCKMEKTHLYGLGLNMVLLKKQNWTSNNIPLFLGGGHVHLFIEYNLVTFLKKNVLRKDKEKCT